MKQTSSLVDKAYKYAGLSKRNLSEMQPLIVKKDKPDDKKQNLKLDRIDLKVPRAIFENRRTLTP